MASRGEEVGQLTYLIINLVFIIMVLLLLRIKIRVSRPIVVTALVLLVLTAIFDSVLVSIGIVGYDESKILGLRIGNAPVEDFMYTILAVLMIPGLWQIFDKGQKSHASDT